MRSMVEGHPRDCRTSIGALCFKAFERKGTRSAACPSTTLRVVPLPVPGRSFGRASNLPP